MKINILAVIMVLIMAISGSGIVFAANSATLQSMDVNKSVGYVGVQNYTNDQNGSHINALCVDENTYIYFGDSVPITTGTAGVPQSNSVKLLIVNNYRDNMTQQQGANLQEAIWFFSNGKIPTDPAVLALINSTQANSTVVNDSDYKQVLSNNTTLVNETINSTLVKINTNVSSITNTTNLGNTTTVQTIVNNAYTKVITTIQSFFQTQTTTNTTNTYLNITTITDFYQTTVNSLIFNFDSYTNGDLQKLIFFTDTPLTEIFNNSNSTVIPVYSNNSTINITTIFFNTTNKTSKITPIPPVNNTTIPKKTNETAITTIKNLIKGSIPMQHTGVPLAPLAEALIVIAGSIIASRRFGG